MRLFLIAACAAAALLAASSGIAGEVPTVDYRAPMKDGTSLVGIECHKKNKTLELALFNPDGPPAKRMDLWRTDSLVVFNNKTSDLEKVLSVERSCNIDADKYKIKITGVPGAHNAMQKCGAFVTAHATVWKNGSKLFDEDFEECFEEHAISTVRFLPGNDKPEVKRF